MEADTKLMICWAVGKRDGELTAQRGSAMLTFWLYEWDTMRLRR